MTTAKVMDVIARVPGCAGHAADAVSVYSQVKMEDAPTLLKMPKSECPDIWIRLPKYKWPKSWSSMEDPVVPLEHNLYGHPLAGLLWERQFEKVLLEHGWEKVPSEECLFVSRETGLFLSVYVDEIKLAGKKQNIEPMWKILMKDVDLGDPTFSTMFIWVALRESVRLARILWIITQVCSNRGFPQQSPIASKSLGILRAPCQLDWKSTGRLVAREHNQDAASSSQVW